MVTRAAVLFLFLGLAPSNPVSAGNGADALPFLKVATGARAAGMGVSFAALADDSSALFQNPAGMTLAERKEVMFSHAEWLEGIRNECLSYVHPTGTAWAYGAGASMLFSGAMTKYDRDGVNTGNFTENEGVFSLGAARALGDSFSGGLAVKSVYQRADKETASAYAVDAGLLYHEEKLRFALVMENAGSKLKLYHDEFSLPLGYKAAAAWRVLDPVWVTAQVTHRPIGGLAFAAGGEYEFVVHGEDAVFVRAGFMSGPGSGPGIAMGLGMGNRTIKLDYAFTPFGDLGNAHRLSLSVKFGEDKETLRDREWGSRPRSLRKNKRTERQKQWEKQQGKAKKDKGKDYFTW